MPTVTELALPGLKLVRVPRMVDERGWFSESWQRDDWLKIGITADFMQDNLVMNDAAGILRGLHWQNAPHAQTKLVRCLSGAVRDVVLDLRRESPTYRRWAALTLTADAGDALLVPQGFAHGYVTLMPKTLVLYKVDHPWVPGSEAACRWNDPYLDIDWGATDPILSEKDAAAPLLNEVLGSAESA